MIEVLGTGAVTQEWGLEEFLRSLEQARSAVAATFAPVRIELVARVSEEILRNAAKRPAPGVVHFAYWTRRSALRKLAESTTRRLPERCIARPRGLTFHLPPQNVETVFLYSWVISYLLGNSNIVRLPTSLGADMMALLDLFQQALGQARDESQNFVRYRATDEINRAISGISDARIVWGGDAKVRLFADLPLRDGGKALWFGDRRSVAILDAGAVAALDAAERRSLAERLHNDIFVFDQMACSSPQRLFVRGDALRFGGAVRSLLDEMSAIAMDRGSVPATGHVIQKMVASMTASANGQTRQVTRHSNALTTLVVDKSRHVAAIGGGFMALTHVNELDEIYSFLDEKVQTVVHFGFTPDELTSFSCKLPPFCVTRMVPAGAALDFDIAWDGYDLSMELTKLLRVG